MESLSRKNLLCKNLSKMKKLYPKEYSFFPTTWLLPLDWSEFRIQFSPKKSRTYIVKPEAMSQGRGIYLAKTLSAINPEEHCIVQRYLNEPMLIDGLKFDLRIYVLVYGCDPYSIFMYKEGLVRLATEPYETPKSSNLTNLYMHLTNYAINKDNEKFEFNKEADHANTGHKRSLEFVWNYIKENGGDPITVKNEIKKCIVKTFCTVQPMLAHMYKSCQPNDFSNNKCFEILGFDIMLDNKMKPWLIEVNHDPSFATDTPFDHKVKSELLADTFHLIHLNFEKRLKYNKKKYIIQRLRLTTRKDGNNKLNKEDRVQIKAKKMAKRDEYESHNLGNYEIIYPDKVNEQQYTDYIKSAEDLWETFTGGKKKSQAIERKPTTRTIINTSLNKNSSIEKNKSCFSRTSKEFISRSYIAKPPIKQNIPADTQSLDCIKYSNYDKTKKIPGSKTSLAGVLGFNQNLESQIRFNKYVKKDYKFKSK